MESILRDGFDVEFASDRAGRYGDGIYFSDASCKSHQYAQHGDICGGAVYCMLYCRVALGDTMRFNATKKAAARNFLVGMKRPGPGDPVFEERVVASGGKAKARSAWHSVAVLGGSDAQVHREYVVFDGARVYPEYVVYYRLDSEEEEVSARQPHIDAAKARLERVMQVMAKAMERRRVKMERENAERQRKQLEWLHDFEERERRHSERRQEWQRQHDAFMAERQRLFEIELCEVQNNPQCAEQKREEVQRLAQRVREELVALSDQPDLSADDRSERVSSLLSQFQNEACSTLSPALTMTPPSPPRSFSPAPQRLSSPVGRRFSDSSDSSDDEWDEFQSFFSQLDNESEEVESLVSAVTGQKRLIARLMCLGCEEEAAEEELQKAERRVVDFTPHIRRPELS